MRRKNVWLVLLAAGMLAAGGCGKGAAESATGTVAPTESVTETVTETVEETVEETQEIVEESPYLYPVIEERDVTRRFLKTLAHHRHSVKEHRHSSEQGKNL